MNSRSQALNKNQAAKPNPDVLCRRLGDDLVLFHLKRDRFYELNTTATRFWKLLAAGNDVDDAGRRMLDEFAVDPHQLMRNRDHPSQAAPGRSSYGE